MQLIPVDVILILRCKYMWQKHVEKHSHDYYQMIYITGGEGEIVVNNSKFSVKANDIYFFVPSVEHELFAYGKDPMSSIEVKFHVNDCNLKNQLSNINVSLETPSQNIKSKLEELLVEAIEKSSYFKELVNIGITEVLYELLRGSELKRKHAQNMRCEIHEYKDNKLIASQEVKKVFDYIQMNFTKEIALKQLGLVANLNSTYLCKMFTNIYKVSPIQLVNSLRLNKSKELLAYTDLSITQISDDVGFKSIHYFSRYFKSKENMSPIEYKHYFNECISMNIDEEKEAFNF